MYNWALRTGVHQRHLHRTIHLSLIYCGCASCMWSDDGAGQVELISGFLEGCRSINTRGRSQWGSWHPLHCVPGCFVGPDPRSLRLVTIICRCVCPAWAACHCAPAGWLGGTGFTGLCSSSYNYSQRLNTDTNSTHSRKPGSWFFPPCSRN